MIQIKPIASGSSGNCYYISDGNSNILLDCGIPVQKIKEFLWNEGKRLSDIDACLVTHSHSDHVKSAQKLADMGIDVYASMGTIESSALFGKNILEVLKCTNEKPSSKRINDIQIRGFLVEHDAPETFSFLLINLANGDNVERLLYITDTPYFPYAIGGVTHLMIEANNDPEIIAQNVAEGKINAAHAKRVVQNHMSIETCLKTIERMDRSRLKEIWLLHLSKDNAGDDFKRRVQELAGCEVYVA